jgi:ABC-type polysaccharide/polyol phosphate transport system ATPase subunit
MIKVNNISKTFKIPLENRYTFKENLVELFRVAKYEKIRALDDVSFEVQEGEFLGIIGPNCSGKSTLLKILANILVPTSGLMEIQGKVSPFLELGVGFNLDLTARENVYQNGIILGLSRKQVDERFNKIIEFSELERFVDTKMKNFSSGMHVRLAFSVAIQVDADILLMDEVLAVGDMHFQQKCFDVFNKYKEEKKTIVLVTHDMGAVQRYCSRAIFLNEGKIMMDGKPDEVVAKYTEFATQLQ